MLPTYRHDDGSLDYHWGRQALNGVKRPGGSRRGRAGAGWRVPVSQAAILLTCLVVLWWEATSVSGRQAAQAAGSGSGLPGRRRAGKGNAAQRQLAQKHPVPHVRNLVLVACHSVYTGLDFRQAEDVSSWFLLDYQKDVPGQTHSFVEHIRLGVQQAAADPSALLLFSGGKTRRSAGPRAESEGYWLIAEAANWYGHKEVRERALTEDRARDSLENLLFSLCRFFELTGRYPEAVTLVGYEFKRDRFSRLHRTALRWPEERFSYVGTPALTEGAAEGEARTAAAFEGDPYGCTDALQQKRASRDPFSSGGPSGDRCPAMAELLTYCGPELFDGPLPWDGTV